MNSARTTGRLSAEQEILLRAALLQGESALAAWQQWTSAADIDRLRPGSYRLLPLLYRNLSALGVDDPLMSKLKGIYRQTWYKNQLLLGQLAGLVRTFHQADIPTLLLGGAALSILHYHDLGARPVFKCALLVPAGQALQAVNLLARLGWRPQGRPLDHPFVQT